MRAATWYDGFVNFTSVLCRNRSIGGWRTRQRRSYFALKLPDGWWLWGIDVQFGASIDEVQLRYFAEVAADQVQRGDRVIVHMRPAVVRSADLAGIERRGATE